MQGSVLRVLFVATMVAAAVSWVGLPGRSLRSMTGPAAGSAAPKAASDGEARPFDFSPSPGESPMPSLRPWPELNPEASVPRAWALATGPRRRPGDLRRVVTITFDDGPSPDTTPKILKQLARHKIKGTFFVIGRYLDGDDERARDRRAVLERIVSAGHLVGNHTHDHALLTQVSHTQVLDQIDRGAASIEHVTGKKPIVFRPPFGQLDDFGRDAVRARGLDMVLWSVEAKDMERSDVNAMFGELVAQIDHQEGGIVLLHDVHSSTVALLKKLLTRLHERRFDPSRPDRWGYVVVDLPEYFRQVEASPPAEGHQAPALPESSPAALPALLGDDDT
jgi:peptidoglycan-N-acetylglucosamine deacetylase